MVKVSGGGIQGNKVVQSRAGYKVELVANKASPAGAGQLGAAVQFRKEPLIQGKGYEPAAMPKTGVPGYFNSAKAGPGSQRTVMKSGSQSHYGPNPPNAVNRSPDPPATTPGKDILSSFGPERGKR